jgi:hypothetical protein
MSLLVSPYKRRSDGTIEWLDLSAPGSDLAGVESSRQSFWGSPEARALGLTLLPQLAQGDIWVEGSDLTTLEHEITLLMASLDRFAGQESYWYPRLANVQAAVAIAKDVPEGQGGVYIG